MVARLPRVRTKPGSGRFRKDVKRLLLLNTKRRASRSVELHALGLALAAGIHTRVKAHISMYRPHALHARHGLHSTSIGYASTLIMSRTDTGQSNLRCVSGPTRNRLAQPCMEHRDIPGASHKRRMDERGKEPPTGEIHEVVRRTARCPPWLPRRHGGDPLRAP